MTRQEQIDEARYKSRNERQRVLIYKTKNHREFFRFQNLDLVEYDLTRWKGFYINLTPEEKRVIGGQDEKRTKKTDKRS